MPSLGFTYQLIYCFRPYLSSRKFHVNINDRYSTSVYLRRGVAHGLILGEDKTKSILFSTKNRKNNVRTLYINYGDIKIKHIIR